MQATPERSTFSVGFGDSGEIEADRLFAEDGFAGFARPDEQFGVRVGGAGDDDAGDGLVGEDGVGVGDESPGFRGQPRASVAGDGVHYVFQPNRRVRRRVHRMHAADATGAEYCHVDHERAFRLVYAAPLERV